MVSNDPKNMKRFYFTNAQSSDSLVGDWDAVPADGIFTIDQPSLRIYSVWIEMRLAATVDPTKFGALTALSAGLTFSVERNDVSIHSFGDPIKTNEDFELYFQRQNTLSDKSFMGSNLLYINYGGPVSQRSSQLDKLVITSTEDLTGVASVLRFYVMGLIGV